jgi:hypothetical protein
MSHETMLLWMPILREVHRCHRQYFQDVLAPVLRDMERVQVFFRTCARSVICGFVLANADQPLWCTNLKDEAIASQLGWTYVPSVRHVRVDLAPDVDGLAEFGPSIIHDLQRRGALIDYFVQTTEGAHVDCREVYAVQFDTSNTHVIGYPWVKASFLLLLFRGCAARTYAPSLLHAIGVSTDVDGRFVQRVMILLWNHRGNRDVRLPDEWTFERWVPIVSRDAGQLDTRHLMGVMCHMTVGGRRT